MQGPAPKPTAIKKLEGNPGKRALNEAEPTYPTTAQAPDFLNGLALDEWNRLAPHLLRNGLLTEADTYTFASYCMAVQTFVEASQDVQQRGVTVTGARTGDTVKNPSFQVMRDSQEAIKRFSSLFGFSPADRTRIAAGSKVDDEIERLLNEFE